MRCKSGSMTHRKRTGKCTVQVVQPYRVGECTVHFPLLQNYQKKE